MEGMEQTLEDKEKPKAMQIKAAVEFDKLQYSKLLDEVMRVEREAWPAEWQATRDKFEARLEVFPEGFFLASINGKLVGVSTSEIVQFNPQQPPETWDEITDNGYIRKTHNSQGNALYVVSLGVSKDFQGQGIGRQLMNEQKELTKKLKLKFLFLGARIPKFAQFHKAHPQVTAEEYVNKEESPGRKLDPEIRFYESCGLKIVKVMPAYGPDPASEDFGIIMVWENSDFKQ